MILYVNGNQNDGGSNHISLYLRSEETDHLTYDGSINFVLKLFVYNGKQDKYLTVTGSLDVCGILLDPFYITDLLLLLLGNYV